MRTVRIALLVSALLLTSLLAGAQTPADGTLYDFRSRTSVGIDWRIVKGLHLDAGYELRTADKFTRIERHQVNVGIEYSPLKYLDLGAGYCFIGHYDGDKTFKPRHRAYFDLGGSYRFGAWKLSLRERVQLTHKSYEVNPYQQTPNLVELKSRLKLAYKGLVHLEPYAYVELRNCFNAPSFTFDYDEQTGKYSNYKFTGYSDAYVNRVRGVLGLEWKITRSHSIDFRFMTDWCHEKAIDVNSKGTKLKSYCWEQEVDNVLGIGYVFSF